MDGGAEDEPGRDLPGRGLPGQDVSGQDVSGQDVPGRGLPGQDVPGEDLSAVVRGAVPEGLVDLHTHFLPERVLRKVWAYFDDAERHYGVAWPVRYRLPEEGRVRTLARLGVTTFAPLVYDHRPGMAAWLNDWVADFAARTPGAVRTATVFPDPDVARYLARALDAGAQVVKVHVQVGGFDPREEVLD